MKATYKQLKADWERYNYGMEPILDIPPMFIYAWNCGLERARLELEHERPRQTDAYGCGKPDQEQRVENGLSEAIHVMFQRDG